MTVDKSKEEKLADYILTHPQVESVRGNPREILRLIEEYAPTIKLGMIIGPHRGQVIIDEIKKVNPKVMIELGCYVGYSAILFASELPEDAKYYSFEVNEKFAAIATKLIRLAGLTHKIEIFVGKASDKLPEFRDGMSGPDERFTPVDFIFIDHWKDMYVPDLRILETLNLIAPGTVIAADNIIYPGAPDYAKYVKGSPKYRKEHNMSNKNKNGTKYLGRWNILYESETIEVVSPNGDKDGVEISKCVDYLSG
ncbi:catechol o methyltransferase [Spathaspora passalidarum NRRL Y-27907]|uniref:catechol O-methyltransferase n=1 Tax=Spathaspora passalidarum (strain NRRL Y-27907 / 11-Y1) TaxID=619300 RepID=G3AVK8_SPAPN|nr:catechol o methyltransferase [Spathaspora passalidarum NRRL Y-27907]EGW29957.1 catechol o methyltransferase [Spathaspora passalidarum NRRL Y-27907]